MPEYLIDLAAVWKFLNSDFWTSLVGAGLGAVAGAWAAQQIAEKSAAAKQQLEEVRHVNAAISMAVATTNTFAAIKRQHVAGMKEAFDLKKAELEGLLKTHARGPKVFEFQADLQTFSLPRTQLSELRDILFNKITARNAHLSILQVLVQTSDALGQLLSSRNDYIEEVRAAGGLSDENGAFQYFGLRDRSGRIDTRYADFIEGVFSMTEDSLVLSVELTRELVAYGNTVAQKLGTRAPKITKPDFSRLEELEILPDPSEHQDFLERLRGAPNSSPAVVVKGEN